MAGSEITSPKKTTINYDVIKQSIDAALTSYREKTGVKIMWYYEKTRRRRSILVRVSIPETDKNRAYMVAANIVKWLKDQGFDASMYKPLEPLAYVHWWLYVEIKVRT